MKILFFGTPAFSVPFLATLAHDEEIEIVAVVTQPDKPVGRKKIVTAPAVKDFAQNELDIPVLQPKRIKGNNEFLDLVQNMNLDFIVVVAYGMIFPEELLEIPKYGCVNVHTSLLPKYRGASPIQSALLNGDKNTGVSIMNMEEEMDTGGIYLIRKIEIGEKDDAISLSNKLSEIGAVMIPLALKDIADRVLSPIPQNETNATYCKKINKEDGLIDPANETSDEILNKFKAFIFWPQIHMIYENKKIKLLQIDKFKIEQKVSPGQFIAYEGNLLLGTKEGTLKIDQLQPEGKNSMQAKDFMNGFLQK
ncbi:methionyl-tRNA formyltransferase [Patescibacteria group bacterium]|nr:methionyl-tRNA formyltransferase [Patescibacteria group bacterium]